MKIGRNETCPCGSGKKHKKCCLSKTETDKYFEAIVESSSNLKRESKIKHYIHPDKSQCTGNIIKAHAIQNNRILSNL